MAKNFLAVDIGTSFSKGVVIDSGGIISEISIPHRNIEKHHGVVEQDSWVWWKEFVKIVAKLNPKNIECVCVSGIWPTFCPADGDGNPLYNAILFNDNRTLELIRSSNIYSKYVKYGYEYPPKISWFRKYLPNVWNKTRKIFSAHNFIVYQLTGQYCLDSHTANSLGGIFNPITFDWDPHILRLFNIPREVLPQVFPPSKIVGHITDTAARETGLVMGTPVVTGVGDTFVSIIGSGANIPADIVLYFGTVGMVIKLTKNSSFLLDANQFLDNDEGALWLMGLTDSGKQLEWGARILSEGRDKIKIDWDRIEGATSVSSPGANGIIFVQNNDFSHDFDITYTPSASIFGIRISNTKKDICRAIYESFGYAVRNAIETSMNS